jgi:integrase
MPPSKAQLQAQLDALQARIDGTGFGSIHTDPESERAYVKFRVGGKSTTRRRYPDGRPIMTTEDAVSALGQWETVVATKALVVGRVYFEDFWPTYLTACKAEMTRGSWDDVRYHGTNRLLPFFSGRQLKAIDVPTVREWRSVMYEDVEAGELAPKTVNNARVALKRCLDMALEDHHLAFNPVVFVKPLKIEFLERPYLSLADIHYYLFSCSDVYRALARFLLATGVRVSEAIAVRVSDLNLDERYVKIVRQRERDGSDTVPTKGKNFRRVYFGPEFARFLQGLISQRLRDGVEDGGWLFVCPPSTRARHAGRSEPKPPHRKTVHDWHEAALKVAGIEDMPLHSLRHTAAAAWLAAGNSLEFVKRQLGHADISTTSHYYGHMEAEVRAAGAAETEARVNAAVQLGVSSPD